MDDDSCDLTNSELISLACRMYANWIETKDPMMSARDMVAAGKYPPALDTYSMDRINRLRFLADTFT